MAFLRGKPLLEKLSTLSVFVVLPATMVASLIYSPPDFASSSSKSDNNPPKGSSDS